jgi:glycine/D-amino acid oxidase-like deaminating enzyme
MDVVPPPRRTDAVVIGGGCMGASTAFHLARRGLDVVLLERDHVGAGATGHSGAIVRQHYETRVGIRLARDSLAFFSRFEEETGLPCDFRRTGFLSGTRERDLPAFEALLALLRSEGVRAERLGPAEASELEPRLAVSDYAALVHDPDAGYADPIATAVGFAEGARRSGATVLEGRGVREIVIREGRAAGVRLRGGGMITSERVVLAAGNWTPTVARPAGVRLPVRFVRGEVAILRRPPDFGAPPRIHFDFYSNTYSRPEGEKDVLVGYLDTDPRTAVPGPVLRDDAIAAATVRDLKSRLARRFPIIARAQPRGGWSGLYDVTPDAYPIVDAVGPGGLFVAVGFSGHGFKLCPEVGRLLGEFAASGRRPDALVPLRASRYREGEPVKAEAPFPARRRPRLP